MIDLRSDTCSPPTESAPATHLHLDRSAVPLCRIDEIRAEFSALHKNQDDQAANRGRFERAIRDKAGFEMDDRIVHREKGIRDIHAGARAVLDGSSNPTEFVGTVIDITERTRAEQVLWQSEADLRTITDTIRHPIGVLAPDGTQLYANRVALDYGGLTLGEAIKEGLLARLCHPDDINQVRDERRIGLLEGVPFDLEMRLLHKSGQYRWNLVQYNPLKDEGGQIIRWYFTATDIDDRKRAEEMLRQSEAELRTITEAIRQPISVLAPDGTMLYANRVALDNSGLTLDEVIKEDFIARLVHPDDVNRVRDEHRIGLLEGVPFDLESRLRFKSE